VPITFVERTIGESKMSNAIVAEAFWRVTWWGLRSGRRGRRQELLLPEAVEPTKAVTDAAEVKNPPSSRGTTGEGTARRV
jgi:hypothetical protein